MEDVKSTIDDPNIVLETLADHFSYMKNKPSEKQPTENKKSITSKPMKVASKRTNAEYGINQGTTFIDHTIELLVGLKYATVVGRELDVEEQTAQQWWRSYEETGEMPIKKIIHDVSELYQDTLYFRSSHIIVYMPLKDLQCSK